MPGGCGFTKKAASSMRCRRTICSSVISTPMWRPALSVLVVAEWLYLDWASRAPQPLPNNFVHAEWITLHDNPNCRGFVDFLRAELDRVGPAHADPRLRMLIFCHPQNPTGRAFTGAELEEVADFAIRHDLVVVSDEIHADIVYPGNTHI